MSKLKCSHHNTQHTKNVCSHVLETPESNHAICFTGDGIEYHILCYKCADEYPKNKDKLDYICEDCFKKIENDCYLDRFVGEPQILIEKTNFTFNNQFVKLDVLSDEFLAIAPNLHFSESVWIGLTKSGNLLEINLDHQSTTIITNLQSSELDRIQPISLHISPDGNVAALVNTLGREGIVIELHSGNRTMKLQRDDYRNEHCPFPIVFFMHSDRLCLVHATEWNRLDISDPFTGTLLTKRELTSYQKGEDRPEHFLDYFHGNLYVSQNHEWIADDGWVWQPVGLPSSWNIQQWIENNVWESEDGSSKKYLCYRENWSRLICWINNHTLAIWGYGELEYTLPAVRLFDVISGEEIKWFPGVEVAAQEENYPDSMITQKQAIYFDQYLFACSEKYGLSVWDVEKGSRLLIDDTITPIGYHQGSREFLSCLKDGTYLRTRLVPNIV